MVFPDSEYRVEVVRSGYRRLHMPAWEERWALIWRSRSGQDLVEYALAAGLVAAMAGAIMPGAASSINTIFSQANSILVAAAAS